MMVNGLVPKLKQSLLFYSNESKLKRKTIRRKLHIWCNNLMKKKKNKMFELMYVFIVLLNAHKNLYNFVQFDAKAYMKNMCLLLLVD